jgi:hypothetical protein
MLYHHPHPQNHGGCARGCVPVLRRPSSLRAGANALAGALTLALTSLNSLAVGGSTNVHFKTEASLKETFDSNIYLQDNDPKPANVFAARAAGLHPVEATKASWVTSVLPKLGLDYSPGTALTLSTSYAPDVTFYHAAGDEDYVAHRGTCNLGGKINETTWEFLNAIAYIDGNTEGPTFARPDDVPAVGGIPIRDRRAAFVFRNSFRVTQRLGDFFVRPAASSYVHDFKTELRYTSPAVRSLYSYENYIDRQEVSGGVDVGYRVMARTDVVLGYRYGRQGQFKGPAGLDGALIDSPFDSAYHRVLVGVEGSPVDWLKVNFAIGPDVRQFSADAHRMYPAFDPDVLLYYLDASVTWLPTKTDSITFKSTRYEQPAFSSFSMYEDVRNDVLWRHKFNDEFSTTLGFTLYIGDWQSPAHRNDWIYTPNGSVVYNFTKHFSAELAYSYDWVDSFVSAKVDPLTESHEFTRHLATVGLRYVF